MMNMSFKVDYSGKVVVITGAGGVICSTMVRAFAQAGAKVAALNRSFDKVQVLEEELIAKGYVVKAYRCDVTVPEELAAVHAQVLADLGPCDILINGAGGTHPSSNTDIEYQHQAASLEDCKTFFDLDPAAVDSVFKLNFQGTLYPTQEFAKDMVERKAGCILNISSVSAPSSLTKVPAYSAAKAAISNFTQWLAVYFAGSNIRCNAITPGFLVTRQNRNLLFDEDGNPSARSAKILAATPQNRFLDTEDLLGATFLLCDDRSARGITGVVLPVDGGFLAYMGV